MTTHISDLTLRHVDPSKLLFQQRHPAFPVEEPDWYTNASPGGLSFTSWLRGTVPATMEMRVKKDAYYAVVSVLGLFGSDEQERQQADKFSNQIDDTILSEASDEEMAAFVRMAVVELYPFLRAEVYALTGKMQGISGVMLQPQPLTDADRMQVMSTRDAISHQAHSLGFTVVRNISNQTDTLERHGETISVVYEPGYQDIVDVQATNGRKYPGTAAGAFAALQDIAAMR